MIRLLIDCGIDINSENKKLYIALKSTSKLEIIKSALVWDAH